MPVHYSRPSVSPHPPPFFQSPLYKCPFVFCVLGATPSHFWKRDLMTEGFPGSPPPFHALEIEGSTAFFRLYPPSYFVARRPSSELSTFPPPPLPPAQFLSCAVQIWIPPFLRTFYGWFFGSCSPPPYFKSQLISPFPHVSHTLLPTVCFFNFGHLPPNFSHL